VPQEIDEGLSFLEEVSKHVLITAGMQSNSDDARERFYSNRTLYQGSAQREPLRDLIHIG
jgi:hypothetical protein